MKKPENRQDEPVVRVEIIIITYKAINYFCSGLRMSIACVKKYTHEIIHIASGKNVDTCGNVGKRSM